MFKQIITLIRGKNADAAEALTDAAALPILRQQLLDSAVGVETARRSVALVMAYADREKKSAIRIATQLADLDSRAMDALAKDREDLATEAAAAIAHLEAEAATTARAITTYDTEIADLRKVLNDSENRLRDVQRGQRLAIATEHSQRIRGSAPAQATNSLADAEGTLARLQERHQTADATRAAMSELRAATTAESMSDRLAAAGCGAPLGPDAASVLQRLKAKKASA